MERDLHFYLPAFFLSHYFNSHAHVERDMLKWEITLLAIISTHTLTWSVTFVKAIADIILIDFNSHAHVERDELHSTLYSPLSNFNSHAHVERDY